MRVLRDAPDHLPLSLPFDPSIAHHEAERLGRETVVLFDNPFTLRFVCWEKDFTCGIEFDTPFHGAVLDMLISRMGQPFES